jgi:hypothetical protein
MKISESLLTSLQDAWFNEQLFGERKSFGAYICHHLKITNDKLKETQSLDEALDLIQQYYV